MILKKSFTLLELITVVIIVAILAAIATPQFFRVVERSRCTEGLNALGAIRKAQIRYYSEHAPNYATTQDDLDMALTNLKYFNDPGVANDAESLVTVTRSGSIYTLTISVDGDISCVDGGTEVFCEKLGF